MENYEYSGFYIEKPVGNNVFSYDKRENKSIYVPKLINGTLNDVRLGNEVVFNEVDENKLVDKSKNTLPTTDKTREKFSKIKLNEIKKIYETIGINSITKISIDKNKLEMEGVCSDLDVLNNLRKIKYIKYYYIDSIVRDGEYYRFRIKS
ncbi:hypothetical protein [Clostridioides difficile]|uniref:hypothetical protein n=1 Tax=Clostridioides difficile TaxID=1496 RepID=UPI00038D3977|nr:hypothetical protein [Clostridioides difficile]EQH66323.1 hypothetical protein QMO_3339 [Clostridioides difficile DA00305]